MIPFAFGIAFMALLMGFLIGASSSPVAGVAITAGFGVVAAALTYMQSSEIGNPGELVNEKSSKVSKARALSIATLNSVGRALILFSISFAIGISAGIWSRTLWNGAHEPARFPWHGAAAPTSARQAIDWIIVYQNLRRMGYTDAQIAELYSLESKDKPPSTGLFGESLLSPMFSQQKTESVPEHFIAERQSIPPLFNSPLLPPPGPSGRPNEVNG